MSRVKPLGRAVAPELRALFAKARAFQEQGERPEAIAADQAVLNCVPSLAPAHCNLGRLLLSQQRYPEAEASLRRGAAAQLRHRPPSYWHPYGQRIETHLQDPEATPLLPLTIHSLPLPPALRTAAGLEASICADPAAYEARAIALATSDRSELNSLRRQLIEGRDRLPLFDRQGWIRGLEERLYQLWDAHSARDPSLRDGQHG